MTNISDTITATFMQKRIAIIGDLVADQFLHGTIARVSREAPVLILSHDNTDTLGGGAANAAVNVASLGGTPLLIGLVGKDSNGDLLLDKLRRSDVNCDHVIAEYELQTTTKIRVLAGQHYAPRQQVIRIDYENRGKIRRELHERLLKDLDGVVGDIDAIIISDYNYGVVNSAIVEHAKQIARDKHIPLLIDSRFRLIEFSGATTATPNLEEVEQILGPDFSTEDCSALRERLGYEALLVTCGNKGMILFEKGKPERRIAPVGSIEPVDVTGAGDTVIAAYALGLASGLSYYDAANLANHAGGIVVMKKGTASATASELLNSIDTNGFTSQLSAER